MTMGVFVVQTIAQGVSFEVGRLGLEQTFVALATFSIDLHQRRRRKKDEDDDKKKQ